MNSHYKKILVAIDGSEASKKAFEKALSIAKQSDAKLVITHVIDSRAFSTPEAADRVLIERETEYVRGFVEDYMEQAKEEGILNIKKYIDYGSPRVKIAKEIAKEIEADLIICGATGLNAVERFLIGSVSENIVRYATCDVLVVR